MQSEILIKSDWILSQCLTFWSFVSILCPVCYWAAQLDLGKEFSKLIRWNTLVVKNKYSQMTFSGHLTVFDGQIFCKFVSLINVILRADGSGRSSIKQKMIQGIPHNCYKQMFCSVVTSNDLLKHIIITCQLLWLWLPSWISDGQECRGPSCLPVISMETEEVDLAHSLCPHFTSTQPHAAPSL